MAAKDLGTKHTCFKCGTRFYDLKKPEPVCPKCGADQRQAPTTKSSPAAEKRRAAARPVEPEPDEAALDTEVEDEAVEDEEEADAADDE